MTSSTSSSLTTIFAVLTFLLAFFALVARERKTPYIVQSLYSTCVIILIVTLVWIVVDSYESSKAATTVDWWFVIRQYFAIVIAIYALYQVIRIRNQHVYFRDDRLVLNLLIFRKLKSWWRKQWPRPIYEHNPCTIPHSVMQDMDGNLSKLGLESASFNLMKDQSKANQLLSLSSGWKVESMRQADDVLCLLAVSFLSRGGYVQYTSCARHPLEFVQSLKKNWNNSALSSSTGPEMNWNSVVQKIVVVDAYSPHFGFTDSALENCDIEVGREGVSLVKSSTTFAGIHSASSLAFNKLKKLTPGDARPATLVIYECPYALVDLESTDQYRIFLRHVLPAERMWGGMMTVFLETAINGPELNLLKSYLDMYAELPIKSTAALVSGNGNA